MESDEQQTDNQNTRQSDFEKYAIKQIKIYQYNQNKSFYKAFADKFIIFDPLDR